MQKRKKPFSGKQKKLQLQEKRERKQQYGTTTTTTTTSYNNNGDQNTQQSRHRGGGRGRGGKATGGGSGTKAKQQQHIEPQQNIKKKENRLRTVFEKESQEEIEKRKLEAQKPLRRLKEFPSDHYYGELIDIPLRPPWTYDMTKEELENNEENMFKQYLENMYKLYPRERLNHFEHNLEVWRQLWRVCEISDILFVLADCRHPLFHFPPSLYRFVVKSMQKPLVLVLTKTDLVPEKNVQLWLQYFKKTFPGLLVTAARSFERDTTNLAMGKKRRRPVKKKKELPVGVHQVIEFINTLIIERGCQPLDLPTDGDDGEEGKDEEEDDEEEGDGNDKDNDKGIDTDEEQPEDLKQEELKRIEEAKQENHYEVWQKDKGVVVLGFIGHPNVGKSTLINTLKGKKVCSTSRTPGHTKYKQTVYLNQSVMLCDCPGLVFPACDVPKVLQVVCGIYPIAQVREPYTAIRYISERVPLEDVYRLKKVDEDKPEWTAYEICEAYAEKRGYHTQKGRPDTHRAGLEILRDHLDGRVVLYFSPDSAKIDVRVYEEESTTTTVAEEDEDEDEDEEGEEEEEEEEQEAHVQQKQQEKRKTKKKKETSSEEEEEEDEYNRDISYNRFDILGGDQ